MAAKKKKTKKKKVNKSKGVSVIRQYSKEVPYEMCFVLSDGRRIKNIFELIDSLDNMNDDVFGFHVNSEKNDFSNWLTEVVDEKELANKIKKVSDRIQTQNTLLKHLINKLK